jgi:hypothetical protein
LGATFVIVDSPRVARMASVSTVPGTVLKIQGNKDAASYQLKIPDVTQRVTLKLLHATI